MGLFGFGKKYTKEDLQREINVMESLYLQAIGVNMVSKSRTQVKQELAIQLHKVLEICKKGDFKGWETVRWLDLHTPLQSVTPMVQVLVEMM